MENEKRLLEMYAPGETMTFGKYEGKPIQWRVLDRKGKERLLLAEDAVAHLPYHKLYASVCWQKCSLRRWLNMTFYREAFSFQEQIQIINTRLVNLPNPDNAVENGPPTVDKIFLLGLEDVDTYLSERENLIREDWWWLRPLGFNNLSACAVYKDGTIYTKGINIVSEEGGVRPAMWIRLRDNA